MVFKSIFIALIISLIISISKCNPSSTKGLTVDLIHRDSLQSPYYNPSLSPYQRLANAMRRSFNRARQFKLDPISPKSPESDLILSNGEYLMEYSIGTPPIPSLAIADTGSDITWTQCQPCTECFKQKLPLFDPKNSSTYKNIPCDTKYCSSFRRTSCSDNNKNCIYSAAYGDGSFTKGDLATDTITLDSSDDDGKSVVSFPDIKFGCGFKNGGIFDGGESGIVGLGGGPASLVNQLGQGKFSYCLVSPSDNNNSTKSSSSKLNFGANADVSGSGVATTPLVKKVPETFYYLTLEGISVGNQRLEFGDPTAREDGNIIIDSGTTLTFLPFEFYLSYMNAIKSYIKLKQIEDPQHVLTLCYHSKTDIKNIPDVTVHFRGADVKLKYENVFVRTSDVAVCLAARPVPGAGYYIYGNLAQMDFLVGYDLVKRTVSFKAADCGK
ncbi:hypothetical protein ABFX02_02G132100 [Erythranthe guttata]